VSAEVAPIYQAPHSPLAEQSEKTPMSVAKRRVPRLYLERELTGKQLALDEPEAHYLAHVLRLQRDDELIVFNGRGTERRANVVGLRRRAADLELGEERAVLRESLLALTLMQALPKADAMDLIVQKATELGVRTIVPVYTEFSVVTLDAERSERRVEHWRRIAASACEQSGRHRPPQILPADTLAARLGGVAATDCKVALDPDCGARLGELGAGAPTAVSVAVGPEGGFGTSDWRLLNAAGFVRAGLGARVLRAETAALAACALLQARWGDL
jgi:16S rRNA (uracil1498-N3)-methyltransferase